MKMIIGLIFFTGIQTLFAADRIDRNVVAVGQGIASPSSTSFINFSSGYTSENPVGAIYQFGFRVTGQHDKDEEHGAYGAEAGYGQTDWGLGIGTRKSDCPDCEATTTGAVGIQVSKVGVGIRFSEDFYGGSLLFQPYGKHRFGIIGETFKGEIEAFHYFAYGIGYAYVGNQVTFAIDASTRKFEDKNIVDDRVLITPGVMLRAEMFQLTINDRITLNQDKNSLAGVARPRDNDHVVWFGIGLGKDNWHLAAYAHYTNDLSFAGTIFF